METILFDSWHINQNTRLRLFWREFWTVLFLAIIPLLLASSLGGEELVMEVLKSLVVPNFLLYYMLAGFALYMLVAIFKRYYLILSDRGEGLRENITVVLRDVATSFLGLFRVAAGLFFAVPLIWLIHDFDPAYSGQIAFITFSGFLAFFAAMTIHWMIDSFKS